MIQINNYILRASAEAIKLSQERGMSICDAIETLHPNKSALQMAILERCEAIIGTKLKQRAKQCKK